MDRTEYLQLCQKVSCCDKGFYNMRTNIPQDLLVIYDGTTYYPQAYEIRFDKGKTKHVAILHDLKANSIIHCDLNKVDKKEVEDGKNI